MKSTEETMRHATVDTWKEFLANFLGTTIPFLIVFAAIMVSGSWGELARPLKQGDFLLYATSFWVYSGYLVSEKLSDEDGFFISVFGTVSWVPILVTGILYLVLFQNPSPSWFTPLVLSIFTFVPSTIFLFRNILKINIQKYKRSINAKEVEQESISSMMEALGNGK